MRDKVYLLTIQEFLLLLAAADIRELYGFTFDEELPEREEGLAILQGLTSRGFLTAQGDRFVPVGEIRPALEALKRAKTVIDVHKQSGRSCLLYLGEDCVRLSRSLRREGLLELQRLEPDHVWAWLQEEGWVPKRSDDRGEKEEILQ